MSEKTGLQAQVSDQAKRKVLYIEDDRISLILFQAMLSGMADISLYLTDTAEEGIQIARRELPDFIFMDIDLPGMDGIAALGILKGEPGLRQSRFIGLSANAMTDQIELAAAVGFDRYITKPYLLEEITGIIRAR